MWITTRNVWCRLVHMEKKQCYHWQGKRASACFYHINFQERYNIASGIDHHLAKCLKSCQFWSLCSFELFISDILNVELIWLVCYILVEWRVERWRCFDFSSVKMLILIWAQHILWILLFLNQAFVLLVSKNKQYKRWPNCALSYVCFKYRIAAKLTHYVEIFNVISSFFPSYSFAMLSAWDWIVYVMIRFALWIY